MLLRELEAPEVHLKSLYCTIKDSVTVNSISQALQVHNEILRKRTRRKNDRVLSQLLTGSVTRRALTKEETMDAKGSVNSWPWNGSMGLAGLLFVVLFRAMAYICLQFWADREDIRICRRTWEYLTNFTLLLLLLVFISKSLFHRSICNGDLSSIWQTSQWPRQFQCRQ